MVIMDPRSTADRYGPWGPTFSRRILSSTRMARSRGAMAISIGVATTQFLLVSQPLVVSGIAAKARARRV